MYEKVNFFRSYFSIATEKKIVLAEFVKRFSNPSESRVSVLDLGCHDGMLINKLLNEVCSSLKKGVSITAVDPSFSAIQEFSKRSFKEYGAKLSLHNLSAEDYFEKHKSTKQFDWVIASHCLYWSKDLQKTVKDIVESGKKGLIVLRGSYGIYQIQKQFKHLIGNPDEQLYEADNIEDCLIALSAKHNRQDFQTSIEMPSYNQKEFIWLLSFFLQTTEEKLDPESISKIAKYLVKLGNPLRHDVSFFWFES